MIALFAFLSSAFAASGVPITTANSGPADPQASHSRFEDLRVVLRGTVENLEDPAIASFYGTTLRTGSIGLVVPIWKRLAVDFEIGRAKLKTEAESDTLSLQLVPISAPIEWSFGSPTERLSTFAGLGPTYTAFSETHPRAEDGFSVTSGARIGGEARFGLRADLGLIHPPMPPAEAGPVKAIELEVYVARRFQMPHDDTWTGLRFGAWRGSAGLALRF